MGYTCSEQVVRKHYSNRGYEIIREPDQTIALPRGMKITANEVRYMLRCSSFVDGTVLRGANGELYEVSADDDKPEQRLDEAAYIVCPKCDGKCTAPYRMGQGGCDVCHGDGIVLKKQKKKGKV